MDARSRPFSCHTWMKNSGRLSDKFRSTSQFVECRLLTLAAASCVVVNDYCAPQASPIADDGVLQPSDAESINSSKQPLGANAQWSPIVRAFTIARTERSISFGVVAQSQTLIRITALPCQVEPPHQHSPEFWMFCSVAFVRASSSHETRTWLKTTSL